MDCESFRLVFNFHDVVVGDGRDVIGLLNWVLPVKADAVDMSRQSVAINRFVILW